MALRVVVFLGSNRTNRMADRVSKFMVGQLQAKGWSVEVLDPRELNLPLLDKPLFFYEDQNKAPAILGETLQKIKSADAFMLVTCEYNNCLPPALTNLIDHFKPTDYAYRPSSIVCYSPGMYGGIRAAMQARCLLGEIKTACIPDIFGMPRVQNSLDADGNPTDDHMITGANKHIEELEWYAKALKQQRELSPP